MAIITKKDIDSLPMEIIGNEGLCQIAVIYGFYEENNEETVDIELLWRLTVSHFVTLL